MPFLQVSSLYPIRTHSKGIRCDWAIPKKTGRCYACGCIYMLYNIYMFIFVSEPRTSKYILLFFFSEWSSTKPSPRDSIRTTSQVYCDQLILHRIISSHNEKTLARSAHESTPRFGESAASVMKMWWMLGHIILYTLKAVVVFVVERRHLCVVVFGGARSVVLSLSHTASPQYT